MDKGYITNYLQTPVGKLPRASVELKTADRLGAAMVRFGTGRYKYTVEPGLYAIGNPTVDSDVLVSANYKLSFDTLRKELAGINVWILVLDTKGINVWCAAGKGTFGTDELVNRINLTSLEKIVNHRKLVVPQLGAVGVAAHKVKQQTGFSVIYGPVRAKDIPAFLRAGYKATDQMRQVRFSFYDRLILTPIEFIGGVKYLIIAITALLVLSGLSVNGYSFQLLLTNGLRSTILFLIAYIAGTIIAPTLLPYLPGRSFSLKGLCTGLIVAGILFQMGFFHTGFESAAWLFLIVSVCSFAVMNFTGASTYTSLSGVKKEMKIALPLQILACITGSTLWIITRFI